MLFAQTASPDKLTDVKAQGGQQLSVEELRALLPEAKVVSYTRTGSTRSWRNDADGTFAASSDGRGFRGGNPGRARGTWHIGDNGTFCVTLEWPSITEQWCRYLFKLGDKYFGVKSLVDQSVDAHAYEITR
jgi:hypothetical protein